MDKRRVVRWIPIHLSPSLLLVLTINLQSFHLPSTFTILCLSKLPPTSDTPTPEAEPAIWEL